MPKWIAPVMFVMVFLTFTSSAAFGQIPDSIKRDLLIQELKGHLENKRFPQALVSMDKLRALGKKLPSTFLYFEAKAAHAAGQMPRAAKAIQAFLSRPRIQKSKFYQPGLKLYLEIQKKYKSTEAATWQKAKKSGQLDQIHAFLKKYPKSSHAGEAQQELQRLQGEANKLMEMAQSFYQRGDPGAALRALRGYEKKYGENGKYIVLVRRKIKEISAHASEWLNEANALLRNGDFKGALAKYRDADFAIDKSDAQSKIVKSRISDIKIIFKKRKMQLLSAKARHIMGTSLFNAPINECDRLAAFIYDMQGVGPGSSLYDLKKRKRTALRVCARAMAKYPNEPRFAYQYARTFQATKQWSAAVPRYERLARQGYAAAANALGHIYFDVRYRRKNFKKSMYWFVKGSQLGNPVAQFYLGRRYERGVGKSWPKNRNKAIYWFRRAAKQGYRRAKGRLKKYGY